MASFFPISRPVRSAGVGFVLLLALAGCEAVKSDETSVAKEASPMAAAGAEGKATPPKAVDAAVAEAKAQAEEAQRELEIDRQSLQYAGWQHVKAIAEMWRQLPPEYFPGMARMVEQVDALVPVVEVGDALHVGEIDPIALTTKNPAFWRAMFETTPDDPVVALFEQMLWTARGYFDRANWLVDLQIYGPTLPMTVHRLTYGIGEEIGRVRMRELNRRNSLLNNLPPQELVQAVAAARSFRPNDLDWVITSIMIRLRAGGIDLERLAQQDALMDSLMAGMIDDWRIVAEQSPLAAARFHPQARMRAAARGVDEALQQLRESRGAYGERDLNRLADALAGAGFYSEAVQTARRATAMRGFALPGTMDPWWRWLPPLIGADETAKLRTAADSGSLHPVTFFNVSNGFDGTELLPLHPIVADRALRRLQEAERLLSREKPDPRDTAYALITKAETLGHLGKWDEAEAALTELPPELAVAGAPMRVWLALWSGRLDGLAEKVAALDPNEALTAPALPALASAASGDWRSGSGIFAQAAEADENDTEYRADSALMAASFARVAGDDDVADKWIARARELSVGHEWVQKLVRGISGEASQEPVGENISEIAEAGRICEQRFYQAFERGLAPEKVRTLLEGCVATGVVDFVEYTASLLRLREIEREVWDPAVAPPPVSPESPEPDEQKDWLKDAAPSWSMPS